MYLTILFLPLLASLIANNRYNGMKGGPFLSIFCFFLAALLSIFIFFEVGLSGSPVSIELGNWIDFGNLKLEWNVYYDTLTVSMYLPIVIISFLIQIYSFEYMGHDPLNKSHSLMGIKLSNSGEPLKFIIPSQTSKGLSGCSNDACMVTSYEINSIGNRGSKSEIAISVKEQRVDGSWKIFMIFLRCTLK